MIIKIYNNNGNIKVTKAKGEYETTMYSSLKNGEIIEIEIGADINITSGKGKNIFSRYYESKDDKKKGNKKD